MNKNQISKICNKFHLGNPLDDAIPVRGGLIHRMWRITTSSGSFAIKELDSAIMKRPGIHESYVQSEKIAAALKSKNIPVLIDWEGSGLINLTEEVINVSIGWAGETEVLFRKDIFLSIIDGYCNSGGHVNEYEIHDALHGFIGGYLGWFEFNMHRSLVSSKYDPETQQLGTSEAEMTFKKLHFLNENSRHFVELLKKNL